MKILRILKHLRQLPEFQKLDTYCKFIFIIFPSATGTRKGILVVIPSMLECLICHALLPMSHSFHSWSMSNVAYQCWPFQATLSQEIFQKNGAKVTFKWAFRICSARSLVLTNKHKSPFRVSVHSLLSTLSFFLLQSTRWDWVHNSTRHTSSIHCCRQLSCTKREEIKQWRFFSSSPISLLLLLLPSSNWQIMAYLLHGGCISCKAAVAVMSGAQGMG